MYPDKRIGLVLSGGGYRGIAHAGVLHCLEELGIVPTHIAGTSAGAVVGALYATGLDTESIKNTVAGTKLFTRHNLAFRTAGLLDPAKIIEPLAAYFPVDDFSAMKKKLFIARTNLITGDGEIVQSGSVLEALQCSAAIPMLFAPVESDGQLYADGGLTNNFPVEALRDCCDMVIGVSVNPALPHNKDDLGTMFHLLEQVIAISVGRTATPKFAQCDVMIVPEGLIGRSLLDVKDTGGLFEIGYAATLARREELLDLIR